MTPRLIPLQQWYCDSCGQVIESPEQGYVEWEDDPERGRKGRAGLRIVHHALYSPRRAQGRDCYYKNSERGEDLPLTSFVGPEGLVYLTSWVDVGEEKESEFRGPAVGDWREWTKFLRRLQVPYYEEALQFLDRAQSSRYGELNEIAFYLPETLKEIIEHFRDEDEDQ